MEEFVAGHTVPHRIRPQWIPTAVTHSGYRANQLSLTFKCGVIRLVNIRYMLLTLSSDCFPKQYKPSVFVMDTDSVLCYVRTEYSSLALT